MHDAPLEDRPRYRRIAIDSRGNRIPLSPLANAAHADSYGDPTLDDDGNPVTGEGDATLYERAAYGVPVSLGDGDADRHGDNRDVDGDPNRDDGSDPGSKHEPTDTGHADPA